MSDITKTNPKLYQLLQSLYFLRGINQWKTEALSNASVETKILSSLSIRFFFFFALQYFDVNVLCFYAL